MLLRSGSRLSVHRRTRELYLEFMLRASEFRSVTVPAKRNFFLRLEGRAAAADGGVVSSPSSSSSSSSDAALRALLESAPESVTRLQRPKAEAPPPAAAGAHHAKAPAGTHAELYMIHDERFLTRLDPFMPPNWRNNGAVLSAAATTTGSGAGGGGKAGAAVYRARVQQHFFENALLRLPPEHHTPSSPSAPTAEGGQEFRRALARGRYELRKVDQVIHVRKYRAMHKRYGWAAQLSEADLLAAWEGSETDVQVARMGLGNRDTYGYGPDDDGATADDDVEEEKEKGNKVERGSHASGTLE